MSNDLDFSDSTILWSQYAQNMLVSERTLSAIQAETSAERSAEHVVDTARDHGDPALAERRDEIDRRHQFLADLLNEHDLYGMILSRPENLAWLSMGADLSASVQLWRFPIFAFVTPTHRMLICDPTQSARLFEEELFGLGFLHKEFSLDDGPQAMLSNLVMGKQIAWDMKLDDRPSLHASLYAESRRMSAGERSNLRRLGRALALCVETTAATFRKGETERDIAAQLVHRMLREGIQPVHLQVLADDRMRHFRSAGPKKHAVRTWAVISASGRKHGLEASLTRCVAFGQPDPALVREFETAAMAQTTGAFFSRPGESLGAIAPKIRRIYEKNGFADEWGRDASMATAGRPVSEAPSITSVPNLATIPAVSALAWQTGIGQSRCCDTIITDDSGYECVTVAKHSRWPSIEIAIKGQTIKRPTFLKRDS